MVVHQLRVFIRHALVSKGPGGKPGPLWYPTFCRTFVGALGRTRTCDLLIRSQTRSRTGGDREGHGETKPRFYQVLGAVGETGRDRERHGVVVPLWYERRAAFWDTQFLGNLGHEKSWGCQTPRKSLVADNLDVTRC